MYPKTDVYKANILTEPKLCHCLWQYGEKKTWSTLLSLFVFKAYGPWLLQEGENLFGDNMMDDYRPMPNLDRWVFVLIDYLFSAEIMDFHCYHQILNCTGTLLQGWDPDPYWIRIQPGQWIRIRI